MLTMLTFLFWNLKNARPDLLASIVRRRDIDVLMLAECPMEPAVVLQALNNEQAEFFYAPGNCPKIALYTRFSDEFLPPQAEWPDFTIRRLTLPRKPELLLCAVHFPSKIHRTSLDQIAYTMEFARVLNAAEEAVGHTRTVLVGDLNMNPYEDPVVMTNGLHAVMTREIASRPRRRVKFESNSYFYNPMWNHSGDSGGSPAGTFYYSTPKARSDFWNMYDQVLLRAELLDYFRNEDLEILHRDGERSFLTDKGFPDYEVASDQLPILFRLHI